MKSSIFGQTTALWLGLCWISAAQPAGPVGNTVQVDHAAPADVVAAAQAAVADLGKQVVLEHYEVAIQRMNPQWKERLAAKMGGIEAMEKQLSAASAEMIRQGVKITEFKPQGQPRSFEVGPGKKVEAVGGVNVEKLVYTKWLVLVPTLTRFRILPENAQKPIVIEGTGYQAAVADKGKNNWTFIDGSSLTLNELRKLYINLPADLELPPIDKREVR
ncbi:MAG TPA: hypothetical protein VM511_03800 [Luteolibacter sp.]|nr:hypothetical protein [Luteolibacter sp.]